MRDVQPTSASQQTDVLIKTFSKEKTYSDPPLPIHHTLIEIIKQARMPLFSPTIQFEAFNGHEMSMKLFSEVQMLTKLKYTYMQSHIYCTIYMHVCMCMHVYVVRGIKQQLARGEKKATSENCVNKFSKLYEQCMANRLTPRFQYLCLKRTHRNSFE